MKTLDATKSLDRNSRFSVAMVKNRAEQNNLNIELSHLEKEKKTALRLLQNDKQCFKIKYSRSSTYSDNANIYSSFDEILSKYFIPSSFLTENDLIGSLGDSRIKNTVTDFEEIHNMLFTNNEIDKEKILCLHLISAHRTESLTPSKRKAIHTCKVHSPVDRLLERSKRKNIHQEQKMTNMLPIYTIELTDFGSQAENKDLINDGRLATRILLNERVRELINTVLNALRQSNPDKNYEILEMANDISCLKKLLIKSKISNFLDDLMTCPLITSTQSFVLTAPFRVKSVQLEIRTINGSLETLVKQIRQNVLQLPSRAEVKPLENTADEEVVHNFRPNPLTSRTYKRMFKKPSEEDSTTKNLEGFYSERQSKTMPDPEKKLGRHVDTNFVQKNITAAGAVKKIEYDSDESDDFYHRPSRSSGSSYSSSSRSRRSSDLSGIHERANLQPIKISTQVAAIMEEIPVEKEKKAKGHEEGHHTEKNQQEDIFQHARNSRRKSSSSDGEHVKYHLKQTTCPACMERYKIPLPSPKTPRVKPSSVIPLSPGENPDLKTNSQHRISMLINKEMFKLQSYERRFSSDDNSRRNSLNAREIEPCSSSYMNLSPLELAKIEQEIKEKETKKKLEKFLDE